VGSASRANAAVVNALTVDVEDYFQVSAFDAAVPRARWDAFESRVCANTERLLALFAGADVQATFFVLGWVAERFPALVRTIASLGHEIASHGYGHRLVYEQSPQAFREDVRRAKGIIESAAGEAVAGYRAPSYSITKRSLWAIDVLIEEGFAYDSSIYPIYHDRYGLPNSPVRPYIIQGARGSLVEVPGSTVRIGPLTLPVGGGGYFRLLPYAWTRWGFQRINRENQPGIFYVHPWEIDPAQPRIDVDFLGRFRHYRNLSRTEDRLRALLDDFRFAPIRQVIQQFGVAAVIDAVPLPGNGATPLVRLPDMSGI
jgi:polysaccharide deacetylase family protein (PEP-CTERM system associated)